MKKTYQITPMSDGSWHLTEWPLVSRSYGSYETIEEAKEAADNLSRPEIFYIPNQKEER